MMGKIFGVIDQMRILKHFIVDYVSIKQAINLSFFMKVKRGYRNLFLNRFSTVNVSLPLDLSNN